MLGRRPAGQLGHGEEELGERDDDRFVVLGRERVRWPAARDAPDRAGQQSIRQRTPHVRVEVVAVAAQDVAELVGRIGDDALDARQPAVEEALEEVALRRERVRERGFVAGDHLQLDRGAELAHDDVVIVVSAGEDDALTRHLLRQEREESIRLRECVLHRGEQEVEQVAEQDQLVHVVERVADPVDGPSRVGAAALRSRRRSAYRR